MGKLVWSQGSNNSHSLQGKNQSQMGYCLICDVAYRVLSCQNNMKLDSLILEGLSLLLLAYMGLYTEAKWMLRAEGYHSPGMIIQM